MSGDGTPSRTVQPTELLDARERSWSARLRGFSLVTEADVPTDHSLQAARALGMVYRRLADPAHDGARRLRRWPACLVISMTSVAITGYRAGSYWPALWEAVGYHGAQVDQRVWGQAFGAAVDRLGLATFPDMSLPYVGPILMHAGIPTYCLGDLFQLLIARGAREPGLDGEAFYSWAVGGQHRLNMLDVPARRFLTEGGEYASDTIDRCLDLLDRLREHEPDLNGVVLPPRFIEEAQRAVEEGRIDPSATRRTATGSARGQRPRIGLDPFGQGVRVILPAIGDALDGVAVWQLVTDGVPVTVRSRAPWVGANEAVPETFYALPRPVRTVLVSLEGSDARFQLDLIDPHDPLLVFGDDGWLLAPQLGLSADAVWVLHPSDRELAVEGSLWTLAEATVPFGWEGWRLRHVSLEDASSLAIEGSEHVRAIRGYARPRVLLDEPVSGVTTPYGYPVYASPPPILLSGTPGIPVTWLIELRSRDEREPIAFRSYTTEKAAEVDIWATCRRPLVGSFDITVRGPLGRGLRRTVYLAEGMAAAYEPTPRRFDSAGLDRALVEISGPSGAEIAPTRLDFARDRATDVVVYRTASETKHLVVRPPHMDVLWDRGAANTRWDSRPVSMTAEAFDDPGTLLVRLPGLTEPPLLEVRVAGQIVQTVPADLRGCAGSARYDLRRMADTVSTYRRAELILRVNGRASPVAFVRPSFLASGIEYDAGVLRLRGYMHIEGLVAGVYLHYAPWRGPQILPVGNDGAVPLPAELQGAGPLAVLLRVEDPWAPDDWPNWPGDGAFVCQVPGIPRGDDDPEELAVSQFLAGAARLPDHCNDLGRLWKLTELADELERSGGPNKLYEHCGATLCRRPTHALEALADSGLTPDACVVALIATGLAATMPDETVSPELAVRLWSSLPPPAAILTSRVVPKPEEAAEGFWRAELHAAVHVQCGPSMRAILTGEGDPYATVGRFGPEAETIAALPYEQIEALWRAANVVPQAFLDVDSRLAAARQLFDVRLQPQARGLARDATTVVRSALHLIGQTSYRGLAARIEARRHPQDRGGWLALPAMSAALSLVARLSARGDADCCGFEREWRARWAVLAQLAPGLVAIDLVLAEATLGAYEASFFAEESA